MLKLIFKPNIDERGLEREIFRAAIIKKMGWRKKSECLVWNCSSSIKTLTLIFKPMIDKTRARKRIISGRDDQ